MTAYLILTLFEHTFFEQMTFLTLLFDYMARYRDTDTPYNFGQKFEKSVTVLQFLLLQILHTFS